ncbi:hypothetical protein DFP72DRAFT_495488 [Ephemerocybe angulata]|uniref:BTB domain-containing protein n=1 Tax=Ephemerocybe angulata TaxID=980116 RepID=A0A8H6M0T7_9AGAR|nr:hypothetical protein DFP72DRAFT_495488 [Tulosesus angulatus]
MDENQQSLTYIRAHSHFMFRGSRFLETCGGNQLDSAPPSPGQGLESALMIQGATLKEVELLLWCFYNEKYDDYSEASLQDWFSIARLAHDWGYDGVKAMALRYIQKMEGEIPDTVDRIIAYEAAKLPSEFLLPLYTDLCIRKELPSVEEYAKLKDGRLREIYQAREDILRAFKGNTPATNTEMSKTRTILIDVLSLKDDPFPAASRHAPPAPGSTASQAGASTSTSTSTPTGNSSRQTGNSTTSNTKGGGGSSAGTGKGAQTAWKKP